MSDELVPVRRQLPVLKREAPQAREVVLCGKCGGPLTCQYCDGEDMVAQARLAISEVIRGRGGRGAAARVTAAKLVLARDFMEHLSDEDLLAEVRRRAQRKPEEGE